MKQLMIGLLSVALTGAALPQAHAGDREWSTAGKILTGLFAAQVIARAVEPAPVYVQPAVTYSYAPAPAPVVVQSAPVYVQPQVQYVVAPPPPVYYVQAAPVVVRTVPAINYYYGSGYSYGYGYGYRGRVVYGHRPGCW